MDSVGERLQEGWTDKEGHRSSVFGLGSQKESCGI